MKVTKPYFSQIRLKIWFLCLLELNIVYVDMLNNVEASEVVIYGVLYQLTSLPFLMVIRFFMHFRNTIMEETDLSALIPGGEYIPITYT